MGDVETGVDGDEAGRKVAEVERTRVYADCGDEEGEGKKDVGNELGGGRELGMNELPLCRLEESNPFCGRGGCNCSLAASKVREPSTGCNNLSRKWMKGRRVLTVTTDDAGELGNGRWTTCDALGGGRGGTGSLESTLSVSETHRSIHRFSSIRMCSSAARRWADVGKGA